MIIRETTPRSTFRIKVSNDYNFFDKTGTSFSAYDFWGVMTHEFGHATGRARVIGVEDGHYEAASGPCNGNRSTMCPRIGTGDSTWRDLEDHDRSSFNNVPNYD